MRAGEFKKQVFQTTSKSVEENTEKVPQRPLSLKEKLLLIIVRNESLS